MPGITQDLSRRSHQSYRSLPNYLDLAIGHPITRGDAEPRGSASLNDMRHATSDFSLAGSNRSVLQDQLTPGEHATSTTRQTYIPLSSGEMARLTALYPRPPVQDDTSEPQGATQHKNTIFSSRVRRLIDQAAAEGAPTVDLTGRAVSLMHLDRYYSTVINPPPRLGASDTDHIPTAQTPNRPGLLLSQARLFNQMLVTDPSLSRRYANRLTHLLACPLSQGGIRLDAPTIDTKRLASADLSHTDCTALQNKQIQWVNLTTEACEDFSGVWQLLDDYRSRFEPQTSNQAFFIREFQPLVELYKRQADQESVISELRNFNQFISSLLETREYSNTHNRGLLLARAVNVVRAMQTDDALFHDIVMLASTNLDDCADRRANTLLDMELRCELHHCGQGGQSTQSLFEQGLKFLRLEIAEQFAWQHCMQNLRASHSSHVSRNADESVEVMLYIRIQLRDMGFPVTGSAMNYATSINLNDATLSQIRKTINQGTHDINRLKAFFQTFDPWLNHLERQEPTATQAHLEEAYAGLEKLETDHSAGLIDENEYIQALNALKDERNRSHAIALSALSDATIETLFAQAQQPSADPHHQPSL